MKTITRLPVIADRVFLFFVMMGVFFASLLALGYGIFYTSPKHVRQSGGMPSADCRLAGDDAMSTRKLEFATRLTREDVAGLIEALIEGLKDGMLKVQKSGETLELEVPRVVDLEIEAEINDERAEFEIEVSWRTNRAENPDTGPAGTQPDDGRETAAGARASLAEAARKLDVTAKKAAGTMEKVAARKTTHGNAGAAVKQTKRQPGKKDSVGKKPRSAKGATD